MGNGRYLLWIMRRRIVICAGLAIALTAVWPLIGLPGLSVSGLVIFGLAAAALSALHAVVLPRGEIEAPVLAVLEALCVPICAAALPWMADILASGTDREIGGVVMILLLSPLALILAFTGLVWLYVTAFSAWSRDWTVRWCLDVAAPLEDVRAALFEKENGKTAIESRHANFDGTDRVESFEMASVILEESETHQSVAIAFADANPSGVETTRLAPHGSGTRIESNARLTLSLLGRVSFILQDGPQDLSLCKIANHLGQPALSLHESPDRSILNMLATFFAKTDPDLPHRP